MHTNPGSRRRIQPFPIVIPGLALRASEWYGNGMARTQKMTFTLDEETAARIDRTALRLGIPKSAVVRDAVADFAARAGQVSEPERLRMLAILDDYVARVPLGTDAEADAELAQLREARRSGGRLTRVD